MKLSDPHEFFHSLESRDGGKLCTWVGELYLELHQGTYTTQAQVRTDKRKKEKKQTNKQTNSTNSFIYIHCFRSNEEIAKANSFFMTRNLWQLFLSFWEVTMRVSFFIHFLLDKLIYQQINNSQLIATKG